MAYVFDRLRQTRATFLESQKRNVANAVGYLQGQTFTYDDKKNQRQLAERPNKITKKKCKSPKMSVKIAGEKKVDGGKNEKRAEEREGKGGRGRKGREREGNRRQACAMQSDEGRGRNAARKRRTDLAPIGSSCNDQQSDCRGSAAGHGTANFFAPWLGY